MRKLSYIHLRFVGILRIRNLQTAHESEYLFLSRKIFTVSRLQSSFNN